MAQPQGLNIPAILTTGAVGVILTMAVIEGVRAYYNYYNNLEEAAKWELATHRSADELRKQQLATLESGSIPIGDAMHRIASTGGKLPSTNPTR